MEQVILAFASEKNALHIKDILESSGTAECLLCRSASEVKRVIQRQRVSAVICGYKLPDEAAQFLAEDICDTCPVLVIAARNMLDLIDGNVAYKLAAPASRSDLIHTVEMLLEQGSCPERLVRSPRSREETALIERAKLRLIRERGWSEEEAHYFLQKKSMDAGLKMARTAQMILDGVFWA